MQIEDDARLPFPNDFLSSKDAYIGSQTTKGTNLLAKWSKMEKPHQLLMYKSISRRRDNESRGESSALTGKQCHQIRDFVVFAGHLLKALSTRLKVNEIQMAEIRAAFDHAICGDQHVSAQGVVEEMDEYRRALHESLNNRPPASDVQRAVDLAKEKFSCVAAALEAAYEAMDTDDMDCEARVAQERDERNKKTVSAVEKIQIEVANWQHTRKNVDSLIKEQERAVQSRYGELEKALEEAVRWVCQHVHVELFPPDKKETGFSWGEAIRAKATKVKEELRTSLGPEASIGMLHLLDCAAFCSTRYSSSRDHAREIIRGLGEDDLAAPTCKACK